MISDNAASDTLRPTGRPSRAPTTRPPRGHRFRDDETAQIALSAQSGSRRAVRNHLTLVIRDDQSPFRLVPVRGDSWILGRSDATDAVVHDTGVSRSHVRFFIKAGRWHVEDLASQNGTLVGDERLLAPRMLEGGERIFVGREASIRVSLDDEEEQSAAAQLYTAAIRDPLTRAFNRGYLDQRLREELSFAQRHDRTLSVLMLDVDHFKHVNDTYGHQAGDSRVAGGVGNAPKDPPCRGRGRSLRRRGVRRRGPRPRPPQRFHPRRAVATGLRGDARPLARRDHRNHGQHRSRHSSRRAAILVGHRDHRRGRRRPLRSKANGTRPLCLCVLSIDGPSPCSSRP